MKTPILVKEQYSIEAEISSDFYDIMDYGIEYHKESDNIKELIWLHTNNQSTINWVSKQITDFYREHKPVWEDCYISWWWHIHIFNKELIKHIKESITPKELKYLLLNNPFWINYRMGKWILRKINSRCSFSDTSNVVYDNNSKGKAFCFKDKYYSHNEELDYNQYRETIWDTNSFEFRVNDVMDWRVFYMYKAMILAKIDWIRFKKTSEELRTFLKSGITEYNITDKNDITLNELANYGYTISDEDKKIIEHNLSLLLNFAQLSDDFTDKETNLMNNYIYEIKENLYTEYKLNITIYRKIYLWDYEVSIWLEIKNNRINLTDIINTKLDNLEIKNMYINMKEKLARIGITKRVFNSTVKSNLLIKAINEIEKIEKDYNLKIDIF